MTTVYSNNWDSETTGTLPTGWVNKTGTWQVTTTNPISGTKAFGSNSNGDGDVVLYTGSSAIADMQIDTKQKAVAGSTKFPLIGHVVRSDSANSNHYVVLFSNMNGTTGQILFFKKVSGSYTQVQSSSISLSYTTNDIMYVRTSIIGNVISVYAGNGSLPGSPIATCTDNSISAAGYPGLYNGKDGQTVTMTIDDFVFDDTGSGGGATAITLTGPSSGTVGVASSNFTVGANGTITGTITVTPSDSSGGGTFTPTSVNISSGTPTATFTYTAASAGTKTISVTNNGGLSNPSSISYSASASGVNVNPNDSNWFWSPLNWNTTVSSSIAVNGGAYFKLSFTGTSVAIKYDTTGITSGQQPSVRYMVDNGPQTDLQLSANTASQFTISGLASGTHTIEVWYLSGWWENIGGTAQDRWTTPVYSLKITGATLDSGASTASITPRTNTLLWFGDSISEGIRSNNSATQPGCQNAYESVPAFLANGLNAELANVSFGGQNYSSGFNSIPAFNTAYASVYNGATRLSSGQFITQPTYIAVWHGANGGASSANVQTALGNLRTAAPTAWIFIIVPVGGFGRSGITSGVAAYLSANPSETKVKLIDLGSSWETGLNGFGSASQQGIDNLHPRSNWNARIASAIALKMQAAMDGATTPTTTPRTVSLTFQNQSGTIQANVTGLKWAFFDQTTPNALLAPIDTGTGASLNGSGVLTLVVDTTLASGGTGWLTIGNSDGTSTQSNQIAFSGPVVVS